jgi:hypothetical protein
MFGCELEEENMLITGGESLGDIFSKEDVWTLIRCKYSHRFETYRSRRVIYQTLFLFPSYASEDCIFFQFSPQLHEIGIFYTPTLQLKYECE